MPTIVGDQMHGNIRVMTAAGRDLRRLTTYAGADESPDRQSIPAPRRRDGGRRRLVAFLYQRSAGR